MTEKPKKPSSSFCFFLLVVLLAILAVFFVFAAVSEASFFVFLSFGLTAILLYLFPLRWRLNRRHAEIVLQSQNLEEKRNLLEAEIKGERSLIESLREKIIRYGELKVLTERLSLCLSLHDTSEMLSEQVDRLFRQNDRTVILYLLNPQTWELGLAASCRGGTRVNIKAKRGDFFEQSVLRTLERLLIEDTHSDYRFDAEKAADDGTRTIRSLMSVPLMVGNKIQGILRMDSPHEKNFTTEDMRFLTTIADLGAVALENAQLYERVEQLAIKDGLTGLYLRRYFLERLATEVSRQMRRKGELSFLMLDLDKFKQYNDRFGHAAGDIVLRTVAMILADFFRQAGDLICRYGGEEFCVLLPDCPRAKALVLAEELRRKIAEQSIVLRREKTHMTVSIGVASFPQDSGNPKELIHKADTALYQAKEKGRNQVVAA